MGSVTTYQSHVDAGELANGEVLVHDLRPAVEAVVTAGLVVSADHVRPATDRALLLVPLAGGPLDIRFGETIREEIRVRPGGAVVVAAHAPLMLSLSAPVRALTIAFGEDVLRTAPVPVLGRRPGHLCLHSGCATRPEGIVGAAGLLAQDMRADTGGFAFRSALTLAILEGLACDDGIVRHREAAASPYTGAGIERALALIEENLVEPLPLDRLAAAAGISPFHLSRSFRRITGLSIQGYIRERRLKEACRLLAETRKPLAEIAYDCGFSSQSRMTTVFRQVIDITPLAFRQQCWGAAGRGAAAEAMPGLARRG